MVDRDLIVERQPFHDEIAECSELDLDRLSRISRSRTIAGELAIE
jgi:hypothetical protein